jgi:small subunit ribosomal protein S1
MDQHDAQVGQEAMPENIPQEQQPDNQTSSTASMEALLEEQGLNLDFPKQGEIRTGTIASITDTEILVSIGTKSEGMITGRELDQIPVEDKRSFVVGDQIPVYVVTPEDPNGNLVLSYLRAREETDWQLAEDFLSTGQVYPSQIIGYNKGGLIVPVGSLRGFVPASQVSVFRRSESSGETPEARWAKMSGEPIKVVVIEVDRQRHRLILSERSALQETRETIKDRLLDELRVGDVRTGRVTSLAEFGAFVNIDGADGLVHLSEISWERIEHPNELLKVGQEVQVKVIAVDQDRKRIGLSIRQLQIDPWLKKIEGIKEGQLLEGTITHLTKFGAFARLGDEMEGLIHISELSDNRINHPKEVVKEGDVLTLRVIKIDPERRRIGLSLRKVDSPAYADLDWKMALSGEVEGANLPPHMAEENQQKATPTEEVSSVAPAIDAQAVNDLAEAPEVALAEDLTEMPMVEEFSEEGEQG